MWERCEDACNAINERNINTTNVRHWKGRGFLGFKGLFNMVCDKYGDIVDNVALFDAGSGVSRPVEDDDIWKLADISLYLEAHVCASLRVDFIVNQTQCCEVNPAGPDKSRQCVWAGITGP